MSESKAAQAIYFSVPLGLDGPGAAGPNASSLEMTHAERHGTALSARHIAAMAPG